MYAICENNVIGIVVDLFGIVFVVFFGSKIDELNFLLNKKRIDYLNINNSQEMLRLVENLMDIVLQFHFLLYS